ncbi:hypothetical protein [Jiangella alkaliphila]|uniref:Uncharacterized protein n=1 Tax=Jiangella alkaliphila TaxID=419479 RepID=A0A1H2GRT4_9ACTN|nr:hypothetical protein [Jiangella alkaliphila]SDU22221.1 hypothetical protein SAMN04488563_0639 [Jiangella alkaliphila]
MAHPFASMLVTLGFLRSELHLADDTREHDGCATPTSRRSPKLVTELELACRVGKIARSLVWLPAVRAEGFESAGAFRRAPLSSLAAVLAESPIDLG